MWICPKCETINDQDDLVCYVCRCTYAEYEQHRLNMIAMEAQKKKDAEAAVKIDPAKIIESLDKSSEAEDKTSAAEKEAAEKKSIDIDISSKRRASSGRYRPSKLRRALILLLIIAIVTYVIGMLYVIYANSCYAGAELPWEAVCTETTEQELVIQCQSGTIYI